MLRLLIRSPFVTWTPSAAFSTSLRVPVRSKNRNFHFRPRGGGGAGGGQGGGSSKFRLLDKFIKLTNVDGSLAAKAPFALRVTGVFFNEDNSVATDKNYEIRHQREEFRKEEKLRRREETHSSLLQTILGERRSLEEKEEQARLDKEELKLLQDVQEAEKRILSELANNFGVTELQSSHRGGKVRCPLHMNLYSRGWHQVLSYSIQNGRMSGTHVFVSDASSTQEMEREIFALNEGSSGQPRASARVSIWGPKHNVESEVEIGDSHTEEEEEMSSSIKIYCPDHLLEHSNNVKAKFLVPTLMNRIYLEAEKEGNLEFDASLMDQLSSVGLASEFGNISAKNIWAHEIKMATRYGDIDCMGTLEGDIKAEILGDGDFNASVLTGNRLKVTSESGDIFLMDDCFSEWVELYTTNGHIHVRQLYGRAKCVIREEGFLNVCVVDGSIDGVVKKGDVVLTVERLVEDSFIELESGNVQINLVQSDNGKVAPYRISLLSTRNSIEPRILNGGEVSISSDGQGGFLWEGDLGLKAENKETAPLLKVKCYHGEIQLKEFQPYRSGRKPSTGQRATIADEEI